MEDLTGAGNTNRGSLRESALSNYKVFYALLLLLGLIAAIVVAIKLLSPQKDVSNTLTDEEKAAIENTFNTGQTAVLADEERKSIEQSFSADVSADQLSEEERRSIEEAFSQKQ